MVHNRGNGGWAEAITMQILHILCVIVLLPSDWNQAGEMCQV